jgi:hypothetical protein
LNAWASGPKQHKRTLHSTSWPSKGFAALPAMSRQRTRTVHDAQQYAFAVFNHLVPVQIRLTVWPAQCAALRNNCCMPRGWWLRATPDLPDITCSVVNMSASFAALHRRHLAQQAQQHGAVVAATMYSSSNDCVSTHWHAHTPEPTQLHSTVVVATSRHQMHQMCIRCHTSHHTKHASPSYDKAKDRGTILTYFPSTTSGFGFTLSRP